MTNLEQYYLTEEHHLFRNSLRDFLDKKSGAVCRLMGN